MDAGSTWGASIVTLGAWELAAELTSRRVPTISTTIARCRRRRPRMTMVAVCGYLAGMAYHLGTHS